MAIQKRNFWNSCPRKLDFHPEQACPLARLALDSKEQNPLSCPWYINSEQDRYCFWVWAKRRSNSEGMMDPLLHSDISALLNYSGTKVHFALKEAFENLKNHKDFDVLRLLFEETA